MAETRGRAVLVAALISVAAGSVGARPAAAQQDCVAKQSVGSSQFNSRVCDMPDYDQRRLGGTIQGDGRTFTFPTLKGDGGCHCVPTSVADLLGYYAQKGVNIPPGKYPWRNRPAFDENASNATPATYLTIQDYPTAEVFKYNDATNLIRKLGTSVKVGDGKCGTSYGKVVKSFNKLAAQGKFPNALLGFGITDTGEKSGRSMAAIMSNGGLVAAVYGKYEDYERSGSEVNVGDRVGGHSVAVPGVSGTLSSFDLFYNDPNNAKTSDRYRQAIFRTASTKLKRLRDVGIFSDDWYYRFGDDSGGETQNLIDGYMAVYPMILVAGSGSNVKVVLGSNLNRQNGAAISSARTRPVTASFKTSGKVIDAVPLPMTGEVAYLEAGSDQVKAIVPGTGGRRIIGPAPKGAHDLEASPTGKFVFALGERAITTYGRDGGILEHRKLPTPGSALAYDWSSEQPHEQRLGVVSETARRLLLLDPLSLKTKGSQKLPKSLLKGSGRLAAAFDPTGRLQVRAGDGSVRTRGGKARVLPKTSAGFVTLDNGTLITARKGKLDAGKLPLDGLSIGGARPLAVSHSGADYSRAQRDEFIDATPYPEPDESDSDAHAHAHAHRGSHRDPDHGPDAGAAAEPRRGERRRHGGGHPQRGRGGGGAVPRHPHARVRGSARVPHPRTGCRRPDQHQLHLPARRDPHADGGCGECRGRVGRVRQRSAVHVELHGPEALETTVCAARSRNASAPGESRSSRPTPSTAWRATPGALRRSSGSTRSRAARVTSRRR